MALEGKYHFAAVARRREIWMRIGFASLIGMAAAYGSVSACHSSGLSWFAAPNC